MAERSEATATYQRLHRLVRLVCSEIEDERYQIPTLFA